MQIDGNAQSIAHTSARNLIAQLTACWCMCPPPDVAQTHGNDALAGSDMPPSLHTLVCNVSSSFCRRVESSMSMTMHFRDWLVATPVQQV